MKETVFENISLEKLPAVVTAVLKIVNEKATQSANVVCLYGDLGAGKTTFTQILARELGITEVVTSPTFTIIKSYEIENDSNFDQLIHIDAYRIENINEADPLRLQEVFDQPHTLICLEWPENIQEILPKEKVEVMIEIGEGEEREVRVKD